MILTTEINKNLKNMFSDFLNSYDERLQTKRIETNVSRLQHLNNLLSGSYIWYKEEMSEKDAEKCMKKLDRIYKVMKFFYTGISQNLQSGNELSIEYSKLIEHLENEHTMLRFAKDKNKSNKVWHPGEGLEKLKSILNV